MKETMMVPRNKTLLSGPLPLVFLMVFSVGYGSEDASPSEPPSSTSNTAPCITPGDLEWKDVQVPATGKYGEREVTVPAYQYWVNSGLFLKQGERATLTATGTWTLDGDTLPLSSEEGCHTGDVAARIGYENVSCFKDNMTFVATEDGILYLGMMISDGLGDPWLEFLEDQHYGIRHRAQGTKQVVVTSEGATVPTVTKCDAASFDFSSVESGWVELRGQNIVLAMPTALAEQEQSLLAKAMDRLDEGYTHLSRFFGRRPYGHQPIRFVSSNLEGDTVALAGNPVQLDRDSFYTLDDETNVIRQAAGDTGTVDLHDTHTLLHELVHNFADNSPFYGEFTDEVWADFIPLYVFDQWGIPTIYHSTETCDEKFVGTYWKNGWGDDLYNWEIVCFLRQFQMRFGWEFYLRFYAYFTDEQLLKTEQELLQGLPEPEGESAKKPLDGLVWTYTYKVFLEIAKPEETAGITELFQRWGVPTNAVAQPSP